MAGCLLGAQAQISEGGLPTTFMKHESVKSALFVERYEIKEVQKPDVAAAQIEDASVNSKETYRVGLNTFVDFNMSNSGTWLSLENGDKIWRLGIKSEGAKAIALYFASPVSIPEGGKLHAYNERHSQYIGAYTSNTPGFQSMEVVQGEVVTLEYYMPAGSSELPTIEISEIAHIYRGFEGRLGVFEDGDIHDLNRADACEVDVACSEINGWEDQRDAVVHYSFVSGGTFVCTGGVMNNTDEDCKPYILSANHCGEPTSSANITQHTWYFNYQRPNCSPGNTTPYNGALSQTMSGGTFRASSSLGGQPASNGSQVDGSDFVLVEMNTAIPASYNPHYAGWNTSASASGSGVGIHHPAGHEKKISTYTSALQNSTYNGGWAGAHWYVIWSATTNGHGVTEGGSSGSPIFNANGQVVGHLSGGSSFCTATGSPDLYGKIRFAWDMEGANANQQLKAWLDPGNTGASSMNGSDNPCAGGGGGSGPCAATSTDCDEYISNVTLGSINNNSNCTNYSDYSSSQSTSMAVGASATMSISTLNGGGNAGYTDDQVAVWVDWNNDDDFTDAGEQVFIETYSASTTFPLSFNLTVPGSAAIGDHVMRVRMVYEPDDGAITPCGTSQWGEVEDYKLTVTSAAPSGFENSELSELSVYPNPTSGEVVVSMSNYNLYETVEITDLTGRVISSEVSNSAILLFDLSDQPAGVYLVNFKGESDIATRKIVKF